MGDHGEQDSGPVERWALDRQGSTGQDVICCRSEGAKGVDAGGPLA